MIPLRDEADLEEAFHSGRFLLFKHSTRCGSSLRAYREVEAFAASAVDLPIYLVDVISQRSLARSLAERLGVRHESPQVIFVAEGVSSWHVSHGEVRAAVLRERTAPREIGGEADGG
jgi:bacillithiol system protein YtxJ